MKKGVNRDNKCAILHLLKTDNEKNGTNSKFKHFIVTSSDPIVVYRFNLSGVLNKGGLNDELING